MKREWQLIREILEYVERTLRPEHVGRGLSVPKPEAFGSGYAEEEIEYHVQLCAEAGYLNLMPLMGTRIKSLTWAGHNKLDEMRVSNTKTSYPKVAGQ